MRTSILILFSLCFVTIYGTNTESNDVALSINQNFQGSFSFKYGVRRIDKELYIHNLGNNVQSYIASKNWNEYQCEEFRNAYGKYMDALKKDRLSADDFGAIYDSKGELGNADEDDYWYDNKGNRISGMEYRALSVRKQRSIGLFMPIKKLPHISMRLLRL